MNQLSNLQAIAQNCSLYDPTNNASTTNSTESSGSSCSNCSHWTGYCNINQYDKVANSIGIEVTNTQS